MGEEPAANPPPLLAGEKETAPEVKEETSSPKDDAEIIDLTEGRKRPRRPPKKKRLANKVRLEKARAGADELPDDHFISHWPPGDRCEYCLTYKQRFAAHQKSDPSAPTYCSPCYRRRTHLDLGKCRRPDYRGRRYFFVGKDDYSDSTEF